MLVGLAALTPYSEAQGTLNEYTGLPAAPVDSELNFSNVSEARAVISRITEAVGLSINFLIAEDPSTDFAAARYRDDQRIIVYNAEFMRQARGNDWISLAILAHEVGHHLKFHFPLVAGVDVRQLELEADKFSGRALALLGATLEEAQEAARLHTDPNGSASHPPTSQRLAAIEEGWRSGRQNPPSTTGTRSLADRARAGGVIELEPGTYYLSDTLTLTGDVTLKGSGRDATRIVVSTVGPGIEFIGPGQFAISDLTVERAGGLGTTVTVTGDVVLRISTSRFAGGRDTDDSYTAALLASGNVRGFVTDSIFLDSEIGLDVKSLGTVSGRPALSIEANHFEGNSWAGLRLAGSDSSVTENLSTRNQYGISVESDSNPAISHNRLSENEEAGLAYWHTAGGTASNNRSWNNKWGLVVRHNAGPTLRSNSLRENLQAGLRYGDEAHGTATSNIIEQNGSHGIQCWDNATAVLTGVRQLADTPSHE